MSVFEHQPTVRKEPASADGATPLNERVLSLRLPSQDRSTPVRGQRLPWVLAALLLAVCLLLLYLLLTRQPPAPVAAATTPPATTASSSAAVSASSGKIALDAKGYVIPVHQILVSPKVSGMILKSYILEGRRVTKGEVLAELEDIDYQADFRHAAAAVESARYRLSEIETSRPKEVGQAEAEMQEAKAQIAQLKSDYERTRELYKQKAVSQLDHELAESKFHSQEQRVKALEYALHLMESSRTKRIAAAQADLAVAEADLAKAKWRLENCTIRAPITGTILRKNAEEGNIVNPIAFNGSYSLCDLADLSDLEIDLTIQERDIDKVVTGQKCKVRAEAFPDRVYDGVVSRLMPVADRAKGAIPVRVKVSVPRNEEGVYLKPEMGAIVSFLAGDAAEKK